MKLAKDGAESRFQGGIHIRTDNEVGLELGKKVSEMVVKRLKQDGADEEDLVQKYGLKKIDCQAVLENDPKRDETREVHPRVTYFKFAS